MDMEEKKLTVDAAEQALPVQELPADIPAEVRQKLAEDLNDEATEDLKQDMREAEKEEANDEEVRANPEMLTKSRLLKLLIKKQYVTRCQKDRHQSKPFLLTTGKMSGLLVKIIDSKLRHHRLRRALKIPHRMFILRIRFVHASHARIR